MIDSYEPFLFSKWRNPIYNGYSPTLLGATLLNFFICSNSPEDYPCLKQHNESDMTVLFISDSTGMVIEDADGIYNIGHYSKTWDECEFTLIGGRVNFITEDHIPI